jgi:type III pantothenate kinase
VVPSLDREIARSVRSAANLRLHFLEKDFRCPLSVRQKRRSAVGADRLAAAYGALAVHPGGSVIVDFGSAVTVDLVTGDGAYQGGAIGPGVRTGLEGLGARCARLPKVKLAKPRKALGRATVPAMLSGCVIGAAGAADRIIDEILREMKLDLPVIATGGEAALVAPFSRRIGSVRPDLTLEGLVRAYWDSRK